MAKGDNKAKGSDGDKKMVEKVNQQLSAREDSLFSRLVGVGLIVLGVLLVVLAVVAVFLSKREAVVDEELPIPTVSVDRYTREDEITVTGETDPKTKVMVWVNGEEAGKTVRSDKEGAYEFTFEVDEEGDYEIEAATIKGWLKKTRSLKSDPTKVTVDWSAPSSDVELTYDENVGTDSMTVSGNTGEGGIKVTLKGDETYEVTSDKNGDFEITDITLAEGDNAFTVTLEDNAGNQKELARKVEVTYEEGDLNGDGVVDSTDALEIPEAAGELDAALEFIAGNKLMMLFAVIALAVLAGNSAIVYKKMNA